LCKDLKRAKHCIAWLAALTVFLDQASESFQQEWERMLQENKQKTNVYNEIEDLKNAIALKIRELQDEESMKPEVSQLNNRI
jgi:ferric-dicitrate binding protein FerR (iron transport regulator)